jgi:hypothetical protein
MIREALGVSHCGAAIHVMNCVPQGKNGCRVMGKRLSFFCTPAHQFTVHNAMAPESRSVFLFQHVIASHAPARISRFARGVLLPASSKQESQCPVIDTPPRANINGQPRIKLPTTLTDDWCSSLLSPLVSSPTQRSRLASKVWL